MIKQIGVAAALFTALALAPRLATSQEPYLSCTLLTADGFKGLQIINTKNERNGVFELWTEYEAAGYFYDSGEFDKINVCAAKIFDNEGKEGQGE